MKNTYYPRYNKSIEKVRATEHTARSRQGKKGNVMPKIVPNEREAMYGYTFYNEKDDTYMRVDAEFSHEEDYLLADFNPYSVTVYWVVNGELVMDKAVTYPVWSEILSQIDGWNIKMNRRLV